MPKILFTGTLDAGKTTLLQEFAEHPQIEIIREVPQDLIDKYGPKIVLDPNFQDMVFAEQLYREEKAGLTGKQLIICDRGTIDIIGFCNILGHPIKPEWQASLEGRYDLIILFNKEDINFDPSLYDLGFDMTEYRHRVDVSIRQVIEGLNVPVLEMTGTHEQRLETIRQVLREFGLSDLEGNEPRQELKSEMMAGEIPLGFRTWRKG